MKRAVYIIASPVSDVDQGRSWGTQRDGLTVSCLIDSTCPVHLAVYSESDEEYPPRHPVPPIGSRTVADAVQCPCVYRLILRSAAGLRKGPSGRCTKPLRAAQTLGVIQLVPRRRGQYRADKSLIVNLISIVRSSPG